MSYNHYGMRGVIVSFLAAVFAFAPANQGTAAQSRRDVPLATRTPLLVKVESSIGRGVRFLRARQNKDGSFGDENAGADNKIGTTALVSLALLSCGESHQSAELSKAIDYLRKTRIDGHHQTYAIGLRAAVFASLPEAVRGNNLRSDLAWLLSTIIKRGPNDGMYGYGKVGSGDFSNSQYGVLGVWYAANAGLEVPTAYWKRVEASWLKHQLPDGGWGYMPTWNSSYASMTAAGVATLYVTKDHLRSNDSQNLNVPVLDQPLDRAMQWLGDNFAVDVNVGRDTGTKKAGLEEGEMEIGGVRLRFRRRDGGTFVHYMLFGYERVGEASGFTRFGTHRWFDEGADYLIETQAYDGSWNGSINQVCDTSYSLLFLSRGRAPVAIQKLQFGEKDKARWNNRPRDAANFIRFMRHAAERHMNWQIVSADAPIDDLREAPVLYIASDRALTLTEAQRSNVRRYVDEGGLLLFVNEGTGNAFAQSVTSLCKDLWPSYAFRDLPGDHLIKRNNFPMDGFKDPIRGLSNGARELAILLPSGDASWKWQSGSGASQIKLSPYAPLANLQLYLLDKSSPRFKGETTWIDRDNSADANLTLHVSRLKHAGNWDPEPLAWPRLANILHNAGDAELHTDAIDSVTNRIAKETRLVHLTSAGTFDLTAPQRAALKSYIEEGGLLLFDSTGGGAEATVAFEAMMSAMFPDAKAAPLPVDHPIYTGKFSNGEALGDVTYRRLPGQNVSTRLPRLRAYTRGGKVIALESPEDFTAALVGYSTGGINGYSPGSAVKLVRNILLWRAES